MATATRKLLTALFLVSDANLSSAWVMVSPSFHRATTRLWSDQIISDDSETTGQSRRCILQQLGLLFPATANIPAACAAAEVDPFAAMDDIISSEIGKPSTLTTTTPSVTAASTITPASDSRDKEDSNLANSSQQSDMKKALQEAK